MNTTTLIIIITLTAACIAGQPCQLCATVQNQSGAQPTGTLAYAVYTWDAAGQIHTQADNYTTCTALTFPQPGAYTVTLTVDSIIGHLATYCQIDVAGLTYLPAIFK